MEDHTFKITHLENIKEKDGYYILPTESISKATLRLLLTDSIRNYLENKSIRLSSPNLVRDFIYVQDLIDFYILLSEKTPKYEPIFNVGTGVQYSIKQVVEAFEKIFGEKLDVHWNSVKSRPWEFKNWQADIKKAKDVVGWTPKFSIEKGFVETINWLKNLKVELK